MNSALALKAEVVLAWQLTTRHRAPRLVLLLIGCFVALLALQKEPSILVRQHSVVLIAGLLSSVAASRLTSRGAALGSMRRTASAPWVAPVGRLGGAVGFALLIVVVAAVILVIGPEGAGKGLSHLVRLPLYMGAIGGLVMALGPLTGASGAAAVGILGSLVGAISPSAAAALLGGGPFLRGPILTLWNVLPLPWRLSHSVVHGGPIDLLVLAAWLVATLGTTAFIAIRPPQRAARIRDP